ncbi:methylenetetrahydromethanopterin dehydrogenase, partial [Candidatus Hakubella thermalkaliphila]
GGVALEDVRDLVHGAIFTRGGENLKNTAIFIGGSDVPTGEKMLKATQGTFFGPVRVSVMLDSNGCNTTSAALVTKILSLTGTMGPALPGTGPVPVHPGLGLLGKRALVLAGTGPVGMRVAGLLAQEGAQVGITSRKMERARSVGERLKEELGAEVTPLRDRHRGGAAPGPGGSAYPGGHRCRWSSTGETGALDRQSYH